MVRSVMCYLIIKYRKKDGNLQLAQPLVLVVLVIAGSISIVSCIFLTHHDRNNNHVDEIFCNIRDVFILLPLTFAGNILLARVWRVVLLLTPVLVAGSRQVSHHESENGLSCGDRCKGILIFHLTNIADFYYWVKWVFQNSKSNTTTMRRTSTALRKNVPLSQLLVLTIILTLPQLVLQILILSVPAMQGHIVAKEFIIGGEMYGERLVCAAETGVWPVAVGFVLLSTE